MPDNMQARASQARTELRETHKAFDDVRAALIEKMLSSPAEAQKTRDTCYFAINALDQVRRILQSVVDGADMQAAIEEMTTRPKTPFIQPIPGVV